MMPKFQILLADLGAERYSWQSIATSATFSLMLIFYILFIGSYLQPDVYVFKDRTTIHKYFTDGYVFDQRIDGLVLTGMTLLWIAVSTDRRIRIMTVSSFVVLFVVSFLYTEFILTVTALISIPLITALFVGQRFIKKNLLLPTVNALVPNYLSLLIMFLVGISIYLSLTRFEYIYDLNIPDFFYDIFFLLSRFSPAIMFLLIFIVPIRFIIRQIPRPLLTSIRKKSGIWLVIPSKRLTRSTNILYLSIFVTLSVFISITPHFTMVGKEPHSISVDTHFYVTWLSDLETAKNWQDFLHRLFVTVNEGDRPFSLLLMYPIVYSFSSDIASNIESVMPAILAPSLVLTIFFLTREITRNDKFALISAFVTTISFQVTIGIYAGFFANWIALIPAYTSIIFILRYLKRASLLYLILSAVTIYLLAFTHVYTFTVFVIVIVLFLLVLLRIKIYSRKSILLIFVIIASSIVVDLSRNLGSPLSGGIVGDLRVAEETEAGISQFGAGWAKLVRTTQIFLGGIYGNVLMLFLALIGSILVGLRSTLGILICLFLSLGILPAYFGNFAILSRVLYDIPFQIPVALSLFWLMEKSCPYKRLPAFAVAFSLIGISIMQLSNL